LTPFSTREIRLSLVMTDLRQTKLGHCHWPAPRRAGKNRSSYVSGDITSC
jgi:hypothetical protein